MEQIKRGNKTIIFLTVKELYELRIKGQLSLSVYASNSDIQRNEVWNKPVVTDFFDTLIHMDEGLTVPRIEVVLGENGLYYVVDGKQRIITISKLIEDQIKIGTLPYINGKDISNKNISELPEDILEKFMNAELEINVTPFVSEEQLQKLFVRLNQGVKLKPIEKVRAILAKELEFIRDIKESKFFAENLQFSPSQKKSFSDENLAISFIMEEYYKDEKDGIDHNQPNKMKFAKHLQETAELKPEVKERIFNKLDILSNIFSYMFASKEETKEVKSKVLHSSNRIILYKLMQDCINEEYEHQDVYNFLKHYFIELGITHKTIVPSVKSTSNKASIMARYNDLKKNLIKEMKKQKRKKAVASSRARKAKLQVAQ